MLIKEQDILDSIDGRSGPPTREEDLVSVKYLKNNMDIWQSYLLENTAGKRKTVVKLTEAQKRATGLL